MTASGLPGSGRPARKYRDDVLTAVSALLDGRPDATPRGMFGHPGFAVGGKLFACLYDDGLALKLPAEQVQAAIQRPDVSMFQPYGKTMREWVYITHDDPEAYASDLDLLDAAIEYVASVASRPAPVRRARKRPAAQP